MAKERFRLFKETDVSKQKIIAMAGHEERIIAFRKDLCKAGNILLKFKKEMRAKVQKNLSYLF